MSEIDTVEMFRGWVDADREQVSFAKFCAAVESGEWPVDPPHDPDPVQAKANLAVAATLDSIADRFDAEADRIEQQAPSS